MDIVIPGVNGFALMRMARMRQRELKVIYVSAFDVPTDEAIGPVRASACRSRRNSPSFPAVASRSTAVGAMPRGSGTVLVVEDNDLVLDYVVAMTTELGHRVLRATIAQEALAVIERGGPINLLFTDVAMPNGMSGLDLAREVRRRGPDVKVLSTSGYSSRTADETGDTEFMSLVKPYSSADLAKRYATRWAAEAAARA
jgi:CheY-like chemotaxis protein